MFGMLLLGNLFIQGFCAQITNIGLFLNIESDFHGGSMEGGLTFAIDKINENKTILEERTLSFHHHVANCDKKQILSGAIQFVTPDVVDVMIGDTCQTTTELAGLVASDYNIPFFDFGSRPQYLTDRSYGTLVRTRGSASDIRNIYSQVADYQDFRWTCLYAPQQISANVKRVQKTFQLEDKKINVTTRENFYYDVLKSQYSELKRIKISCRGMVISSVLCRKYFHFVWNYILMPNYYNLTAIDLVVRKFL